MSAEENKGIVRRWVEEAWNSGNVAVANGMYAEDYILQGLANPVSGVEGIKHYVASYRIAFPDLHFTLEDMVAEGDRVAWRFTARGTHQGELMGIPPTGRPATVTGIVISRFANGKWAEDQVSFDALGMLQQLGVIPPMG